MADELERENYHGAARVRAREQEVTERWKHLLSLLDRHKQTLANFSSLMTILREIDTVLATIKEMEVRDDGFICGGSMEKGGVGSDQFRISDKG